MDMVEDELKSNALPDGFTKETVEQAVARAKTLNEDDQFNQAEELLRQVLERVPEHPGALKELNYAVTQGRVYAQSRFEMLREVAERGKALSADDRQRVYQASVTPDAVDYPGHARGGGVVKEWIAAKGPNLERLGMLAWPGLHGGL